MWASGEVEGYFEKIAPLGLKAQEENSIKAYTMINPENQIVPCHSVLILAEEVGIYIDHKGFIISSEILLSVDPRAHRPYNSIVNNEWQMYPPKSNGMEKVFL